MLFLIMLSIITLLPGNKHKPMEFYMHVFTMASLAALYPAKAGFFKVRDKLSNLTWHMRNYATV
jgi:hypothetical protein